MPTTVMMQKSAPLQKSGLIEKSPWRFFPYAMVALLAFVALVNAGFIYYAVHGFPGAVSDHAFSTGNSYNEILSRVEQQNALDWRLDLKTSGRALEAVFTDKNGQPLSGLDVRVVAIHPLGPEEQTKISFTSRQNSYVAAQPLPSGGPWDIGLTASLGDTKFRATRRLVLE